jgi:hypothetical protein
MRIVRFCILCGEIQERLGQYLSDCANYAASRSANRTLLSLVPRPKSLHKVSAGMSVTVVRGDPQTEPFNEELRWHVPDYCARERWRLGD